jgi:hypothetical protein
MNSFAAEAPSNRSAVEFGPSAARKATLQLIRLDQGFSRDERGASTSPLRSVSDPEDAAQRQQHLGSGTQSVAMIEYNKPAQLPGTAITLPLRPDRAVDASLSEPRVRPQHEVREQPQTSHFERDEHNARGSRASMGFGLWGVDRAAFGDFDSRARGRSPYSPAKAVTPGGLSRCLARVRFRPNMAWAGVVMSVV